MYKRQSLTSLFDLMSRKPAHISATLLVGAMTVLVLLSSILPMIGMYVFGKAGFYAGLLISLWFVVFLIIRDHDKWGV